MAQDFMAISQHKLDFEPVEVRMTLSAWTWLGASFGLNRELLNQFGKLGFVIAGGAAGCLLDICQGRKPNCIPGDVDLFYKGITETHGPAVRTLPGISAKTRSETIEALLIRNGFHSWRANPAAVTFEKALQGGTSAQQYIHTTDSSVLWGDGGGYNSNLPDPADSPIPETINARLQLVCGAEPGVMRWDTIGATLSAQANFEQMKELAVSLIQTGLAGPDPDENLIQEMERLHATITAQPYGRIPVWQRFDFTAVCVELDGDTLICHPSAISDRAHKNLRFAHLHRSPLKMVGRVRKYLQKGFTLDPMEMLKLVKMTDSLNEIERSDLNQVIDQLCQPSLTGEQVRTLADSADDDAGYERNPEDADQDLLRTLYYQALRAAPAMAYQQETLSKWLKDYKKSELPARLYYFL